MSTKTNEVTEQIFELREAGYSIREIAAEVNVPKSTVERILKTESIPSAVAQINLGQPQPGTSHDVSIIKLQLEHQREMLKLEMSRDEMQLRKKEIELRTQEVAAQKAQIDASMKHSDRMQEEKLNQLEGRKQVLVSKFNRLLMEFVDNCQDATWDKEEVEDFIERGDALGDKIDSLCRKLNIDDESLAIWNHFEILMDYVEGQLEEQSKGLFGGGTIEFSLSDRERTKVRNLAITDFDDEYVESDEDGLDADLEEGFDESDEDEVDEDED